MITHPDMAPVGHQVQVITGIHQGRTAIIRKYCNKRIKVAVIMPQGQPVREDVLLQPRALGYGRFYPNGVLANPVTLTVDKPSDTIHGGDSSPIDIYTSTKTKKRTSTAPLWKADDTIRFHIQAIVKRMQELGLGESTDVSLCINTEVRATPGSTDN